MWKLSIEQINLSQLLQQFSNKADGTSISFYSYFAYLLLKGEIIQEFQQFNKAYNQPAENVLDETNLAPRVTRILLQLQKFDVSSLGKLKEIWRINPAYLMDCIMIWINKPGDAFKKEWQKIIAAQFN